MSKSKTGALMVIERNNKLNFLENTGDEMNIMVTQPIIESIFFKNSPLHDGAILITNNNIKSTSHMHQEIENRKQKLKQMIPYQGVQDVTLNLSSGGTELDRSKKSYYGNTDIFSKLPYEDLKTAHTESIIPVSNEDYINKKKYSSVDEYNNHRKQNIELFSKDESEKILRQQKQKDEEYANKIAFQLLEKQELAEKNNKIFMSKLQRIGNK